MGTAVNRIGFGGAPIAGLFRAVSESDAQSTLAAAWDSGVRYFDTAPLYGFGLSENRFGRFFSEKSRDRFRVSTKVGRVLVPLGAGASTDAGLGTFESALPFEAIFDFTAEGVTRSLHESLERLHLSYVDAAFLHDPDDYLSEAIGQAFPALKRLRTEGLVREIGAGMNDASSLARIVRECEVDIVMIAGRYTLLDQSALDDLLPLAHERGVRVIAAGVFNSGILAQNAPQADATYDYRRAGAATLARARRIDAICGRFGVSLPGAAIQFTLSHPAISNIVLGMRSPQEVRNNRAAASESIPPQLWEELREAGLIREDAPVPAALQA